MFVMLVPLYVILPQLLLIVPWVLVSAMLLFCSFYFLREESPLVTMCRHAPHGVRRLFLAEFFVLLILGNVILLFHIPFFLQSVALSFTDVLTAELLLLSFSGLSLFFGGIITNVYRKPFRVMLVGVAVLLLLRGLALILWTPFTIVLLTSVSISMIVLAAHASGMLEVERG
jgi:hypothetical protein